MKLGLFPLDHYMRGILLKSDEIHINLLFIIFRYKSLLENLPSDVRDDNYNALVLDKIAKYGSVSLKPHGGHAETFVSISKSSSSFCSIACSLFYTRPPQQIFLL